jgi:poly-beta-1,6-N-acetyl-D-glucosamine synthase
MSLNLLLLGVLLSSLAVLAWTFVGYPLQAWLQARLRPRPLQAPQREWLPSVSVLIAVHNAAALIEAKLDDLFAQDYPRDRLDVHVGCDGCADDTAKRLYAYAARESRLRVHEFDRRRGKSACLADLIEHARGEVLVLCDVRQRLGADTLRTLCAALAAGHAAVSGLLRFEGRRGQPLANEAYWAFEAWLRRCEARSGSVVGVSGALYAVRRADMPRPPAGLILDDLWVPMQIAARGGRIGLESAAVAWDTPSPSAAVESSRKRRTLAGNWQLLRLWPSLLLPFAHPLWWRFFSHKLLRLLMPFALLAALLSNLALAGRHPVLDLLLIAQLAGWALALAGLLLPVARRFKPARLAAAFVELNLYALLGLHDHLRGRSSALWQSAAAGSAHDSANEARP